MSQLDAFIDAEIEPLEQQNASNRFFDHGREWAGTDFDNDGVPRAAFRRYRITEGSEEIQMRGRPAPVRLRPQVNAGVRRSARGRSVSRAAR